MANTADATRGLQSPFVIDEISGEKRVNMLEGDSFMVTGKSIEGKRFRSLTNTLEAARDLMLANSSLWLVRAGRKFLVERN